MKKFWAILLAMMLVLSMVTVAGATEVENPSTDAEGFTITVNPKDDVDHEYQVYQIFTADVETNAGEKVLTSVKWGTNAKNDTDAVRTGDPVPDAVLDALKAVSGTNQEKLAEITKYWNADSTPVDTFASTKAAPGTSKKLTPGYYLVRDNQAKLEGKDGAATLLIVKVLDKDIVATAKSEKPSVDKQVQDEVGDAEKNGGEVNPEGWGESADHALFENFKFRLVATIPVNADYNDYPTYKLVFNDTMSKGITFVQIDSVKVNGTALKDTDYVCTATAGQKGAGKVGENQDKPSWTLTIEDLKKVMKENTSILVTDKITVEVVYTAYLNEEAQVFNASANSTDNKNSVDLEYSNNPNADGMGKTPEDHVWLFTYVVNNTKYANTAEAGNELEGAGFTLYYGDGSDNRVVKLMKKTLETPDPLEEGKFYVYEDQTVPTGYVAVENNEMITTANGKFNIIGLDHGTYTLKETTVPATYNPLDPVTIMISADHKEAAGGASASMELTAASTMNNKLVNKSGATLPETGGIGTTIFYVLGGMMFVGAALILVVRRKAEADEI